MIYPFKATSRQVKYALHLQAYLTDEYTENELKEMSKQRIKDYISEIKPYAEEKKSELSMCVFDIW